MTKAAAILFGSYPSAKAHDPEIFTYQVTALFLRYPQNVVAEAVRELPLKREKNGWDGIPSMARIREALDEVNLPFLRAKEREERIAAQLADRRREDEERASRPTYAELKAKYPEAWVSAQEPAAAQPYREPIDGKWVKPEGQVA